MSRTVLLTLGRLPKALELARALADASCRVIIAEPFRWQLCKPSRSVAASYRVRAPNFDQSGYIEDILAIAEDEGVDLIVPVSEEALHLLEHVDRLPTKTSLFSASFETIKRLHDKFDFIECASSLGLPVPKTAKLDAPDSSGFLSGQDRIIKPRHGCSGIGFMPVPRNADAVSMIPAGQSPENWVLQEKLEGQVLSSFSVCCSGKVIQTVVYEADVLTGTVAVGFRRLTGSQAVEGWVSDFVNRTGYNGFISFDFILGADEVARAIECNPRLTSGVHFLDPAGLAAAVLEPGRAGEIRFKPYERMQQGYSVLTEAYKDFFKPRQFLRNLRGMFSAKDVVWSLRDPLPFLLMTPMCWEMLRPSIFSGITLAEAAMRDIAWFGDAPERSTAEQEAGQPVGAGP